MKKCIAVFVCAGLLLLLASCFTACHTRQIPDIYIFENISECKKIHQIKSEDATVELYESPEKDKKLKNLPYTAFFAAKYSSSTLTFEIFAYEFHDEESAQQYFTNHTGKIVDLKTNFTGSLGSFSYDLVVIDGKNAYAINSSRDVDKMHAFLGELFSKQV